MIIHHEPVSSNPNTNAPTPRKIAAWIEGDGNADRHPGHDHRSRRNGREPEPPQQALLRHTTRLVAAPNVAPAAIAHPSRPGVRYWIVRQRLVLDRCRQRERGGWPVAATWRTGTIALKMPCTVRGLDLVGLRVPELNVRPRWVTAASASPLRTFRRAEARRIW